ncbi:Peptidase S13, D-Ala-D-Ala carboxypeptidase C [Candidatus Planktophila vernalis]|uniref:D-alanyl-D-alanine carboxypeptidase n=1 Tax=Candidatus Planktophila vernalis TaxID=1884907 RepID=UPI003CEC777C
MRSHKFVFVLALATVLTAAPASAVLSPASIPAAFEELLSKPSLSNPAMVLIDGTSGEVVYEKNSFSQRKPASVMKVFAGAVAIKYLDMQSRFTTNISLGVNEKTLVIQGSNDPWISLSHSVAKKMDRASLPYLAFNTLSAVKKSNNGSLKGITILYSKLYSQDVSNLKAFWAKRGFKPVMKAVSSDETLLNANEFIVGDQSPEVYKILDYMMLWSENNLAERLARLASRAAGNSFNDKGVAEEFEALLVEYGIDSSKLVTKDASGLSKENRVTATMMGQLLYQLRKDPKYTPLYNSLPIGGISGTLRSRFLTTAPNAVGLVRAKTGTLNGTVTLAGYVESTDREYVFVTLADDISRGNAASDKARAAIDRILGRIAAPNIPAEISAVPATP